MDIAIVTGADTRTGLAISRKLIEIGCRVYGLVNDIKSLSLEHSDFVPVTCDLTNTEQLTQVFEEILDKEKDIYVLVNHAKCLHLAQHEKQELNDLEALVRTNLLCPLILTRLVMPSLIRLRGYVVNIGFPNSLGTQKLGSAFLSTELALQEFSERLFEEVRQDGVKVCSLVLDTANAEAILGEGFNERDNHDLIVSAEATAQAVEYVVSQKSDSVISRLVVRPQKREPDAKDRISARKIPQPNPFIVRKPGGKVVIGRLQKEVEPESIKKAPATYMDIAREMAAEEALNPQPSRKRGDIRELNRDAESGSTSGDSGSNTSNDKSGPQRNRRRQRRRGRRRGKVDSQTQDSGNRNQDTTASPQRNNYEKPQSQQQVPIRNQSQTPAPENTDNSRVKDQKLAKKRPTKNVVRATPVGERPTRKKSPSAKNTAAVKSNDQKFSKKPPTKKVAKESPAEKSASRSVPAKPAVKVKQVVEPPVGQMSVKEKIPKKRIVRKVAKKTPKKPSISKPKES
ncbi:MAG: SDR family NAD(P)-dependent oxidoreductase [Verrucomicrobia bacterium]|nr:SDR family NAD(P)-dependent oxidoreductase [Verrucomicrobiota bacterium]MDA1068548.1 SDR family NAD(P)-dependent oxidoreductase [Verrucomicrobiota bacterium]